MGYHVPDEDGRLYVLGLRDICTKSGKDTLDTLKGILAHIDERAGLTPDKVSKKILCNIYSTMSNRVATEHKFDELLEMYRKDVLTDVIDGYNDMPEEDRRVLEIKYFLLWPP